MMCEFRKYFYYFLVLLTFLCASVRAQENENTRCKKFSWDYCDCLANGCLFDSRTETCVIEDPVFANKLTCRRPRSHYAYSGKLRCSHPNKEDSKSGCSKGTSVWGVNVNGKDYVDADGLIYKEDVPSFRFDRADTRREVDSKGKLNIPGASKADSTYLYGTYVYGHASKQKSGGTLVYPVPIMQIGEYELIIKMIDPDYKEAKKRIFDIKINNINTIAAEVDIAEIGGGGLQAVDISILFLVFNSVTSMQIKGSSTAIPIFNGFQLQFAYGDSNVDAVERGYIFSAINLIRYGDDTLTDNSGNTNSGSKGGGGGEGNPCETHGDNANECKSAGCEFDLVKKKCAYQSKDCPDTMYKDYSKCQRNGAVYGNAGVLCKSKMKGGFCTGQTVLALNLNSQQDYYWADRQIPFAAEKPNDSQDPDGLRKGNSISKFCPNEKSDEFMKEVLMPAVFSMPQQGKDACLTYNVPLQGQGEYELSIWVFSGKHKAPNLRCFDVKLNSVPVLFSIDPFRIGGKVCAKNELIVLFKVVVSGGARLTPIGFTEPIQLKGNKVDLNFCLGKCAAADNSFQVSAFSVLKFGPATIQTGNCKIYASNANACKSAGCEYDLVNRKCTNEIQDCNDELLGRFPNCRRSEAFYNQAGVLCRGKKIDQDNANKCSQELISAVNINGKDYLYQERGIQFKAETENDYKDPDNIRVASSNEFQCKNDKDELFKQVLGPMIHAELGFEGCLTFPLKVSEDGPYELSLFLIDNQQSVNNKCWDVKLNAETVLYGIDPARLNGGKECRRNEIIILFEVQSSSTMIMIQGFSQPVPIQGEMFHLNICTGSCSYATEKSFQISAISLMRIFCDTCETHRNNLKACRRAGCEFNLVKKMCVHPRKECSDSNFNLMPKCTFTNMQLLEAGVMCANTKPPFVQCKTKTIIAINLANSIQRDYIYTNTDGLRIAFRPERSSDYKDPLNIRKAKDTIAPKYYLFHDSYVYGGGNSGGGCLTYPLPLDGDGFYYMGARFVEPDYKQKFERCFDIKLNSLTIYDTMDLRLAQVGSDDDTIMVFPLKVDGGGSRVYVNGFPDPIPVIGGVIDFSFCGGTCGYKSQDFAVAQIYLNKITS